MAIPLTRGAWRSCRDCATLAPTQTGLTMGAHASPQGETIATIMQRCLEAQRESISRELRAIPTPVPGCDVHFNRLLEDRSKVVDELQRLAQLRERQPSKADLAAFARDCAWLDPSTRQSVIQQATRS